MILRVPLDKPENTMETIEIRLFKCVISAKEADILRRRNNIELTAEHLKKNGGFCFNENVSRPCSVDAEFLNRILGGKRKKYINPNYLRDTDVNISDDGFIDLRHDLPPERVLQLFWLQALEDHTLECRCAFCLALAAANAEL